MEGVSVICSWETIQDLSSPDCMVMKNGEVGPCELLIQSQSPIATVKVVSSARIGELWRGSSYVSSTHAAKLEQGYKLQIDVQVELSCCQPGL